MIAAPNGEDPLQALVEAARPLTSRVWAAPACAAGLIVVTALTKGGFWLHSAEVIGAGSLVLLLLVAGRGRVDRATTAVLASSIALGAWWFVRAAATGRPLSFFPFGASAVGFGAAFAAVRPLTSKQRQVAAVVVASVGAFEALAGFTGITLRTSPLAIPDQNLWRLASTVTYSNAAGLILAMSLLVRAGAQREMVVLPRPRVRVRGGSAGDAEPGCPPWRRVRDALRAARPVQGDVGPDGMRAVAGVVAVATSPSTKPEPIVAVVLLVVVGVSVALGPIPAVWATRRRLLLVEAGGLVLAGLAAVALHTAAARRLFTSASLFDRNPEWSSAYHQFLRAPWFGVGPDRLIPLAGTNGSFAHYAHNEYLQVAVDAGVIGLLLLVVVVVAVAKSVRRTDVATSCALGALHHLRRVRRRRLRLAPPDDRPHGGSGRGNGRCRHGAATGDRCAATRCGGAWPPEEASPRRRIDRSEKHLVNE